MSVVNVVESEAIMAISAGSLKILDPCSGNVLPLYFLKISVLKSFHLP